MYRVYRGIPCTKGVYTDIPYSIKDLGCRLQGGVYGLGRYPSVVQSMLYTKGAYTTPHGMYTYTLYIHGVHTLYHLLNMEMSGLSGYWYIPRT